MLLASPIYHRRYYFYVAYLPQRGQFYSVCCRRSTRRRLEVKVSGTQHEAMAALDRLLDAFVTDDEDLAALEAKDVPIIHQGKAAPHKYRHSGQWNWFGCNTLAMEERAP